MTKLINYKQNFQEALSRTYISAMFDIDGTLTDIGETKIPIPLAKKLAYLSLKMPLAFATGRNLDHVLGKIDQIVAQSSDPEISRKNWYITCENGAGGYFYDSKTKGYQEFYRINWDENLINREKLQKALLDKLGDSIDSLEMRPTQLLIRPHREIPFDAAKKASETSRITIITQEILDSFSGTEHFEVLDSQLAVHVSPKNANKDQGIIHFAKFLEENRDLNAGESARKIMVIGDQPQPGRNDYALLKGEYGTPFTAEYTNPKSQFPIPIFDGDRILKGPEATLHLLNLANFGLR